MKRVSGWFFFILAGVVVAGCGGESADDLFKRGEAATHQVENYAEAETLLAQFIERYPKDPRADIALQALARVLLNQKKSDQAIARYEAMLKQFPDSRYCPQAQFMIAYIYDQAGDYDRARTAYQKVLDLYPDSELVDDARISIKNLGKAPEQWLFPAVADTLSIK